MYSSHSGSLGTGFSGVTPMYLRGRIPSLFQIDRGRSRNSPAANHWLLVVPALISESQYFVNRTVVSAVSTASEIIIGGLRLFLRP